MKEAFIVSGCRTAIGKDRGALAFLPPDIYAAEVVKEAVKRSGLKDPESIDEVIFGNALRTNTPVRPGWSPLGQACPCPFRH